MALLRSERELLMERNNELQEQLKTSTQMFHQALSTCRRLLSVDDDDEYSNDDGGENNSNNNSNSNSNSVKTAQRP